MSQLKPKHPSLKARLRSQAKKLSQAELDKKKLIESLKVGRYTEKRPSAKEVKQQKYLDAITKSPPARIDEIARFLGKGPEDSTGGILAQYRKMEKSGQVKIIWLTDDTSKLPYVVTKQWLDSLTPK